MEDFTSLLSRAASNDPSLVELKIDHSQPGRPTNRAELVQRVVAALEANTHVKSLSFRALQLTEPDIAPLAELLKTHALEKLDLGYNKLTGVILLPALAECKSLRVLSLRRNPSLAELAHLSALSNLVELDLSNCGLSAVPPAVLQLPKLEALKLGDNSNIKHVPEEIGYLRRLKVLHLSNCGLTELPVVLPTLVGLEELNLGSNPLTAMPGVIGALSKLKKLDITGSQINQLPSKMQQLTLLETLDISSTKLAHLPVWLASLRSLKGLDCSNCPLVGVSGSGNRVITFDELAALMSDNGRLVEVEELKRSFERSIVTEPLRLLRLANMHFAPGPLRALCVSKCVTQHSRVDLARLPAHIRDEIAHTHIAGVEQEEEASREIARAQAEAELQKRQKEACSVS